MPIDNPRCVACVCWAVRVAINGYNGARVRRRRRHLACSYVARDNWREKKWQGAIRIRARRECAVSSRQRRARGATSRATRHQWSPRLVQVPASAHGGRADRASEAVGDRLQLLPAARDGAGRLPRGLARGQAAQEVQVARRARSHLGGHTAGDDRPGQKEENWKHAREIHRHAFVARKACHVSHIRGGTNVPRLIQGVTLGISRFGNPFASLRLRQSRALFEHYVDNDFQPLSNATVQAIVLRPTRRCQRGGEVVAVVVRWWCGGGALVQFSSRCCLCNL